MRKVYILLGVVLIPCLIGGIWAYLEWNRTRTSTADLTPDFRLEAATIGKEFSADSATAGKKYLGKILEVTGTVSDIETDQEKNVNLMLAAGEGSIQCTFLGEANKKARTIAKGEEVTVRGNCTGYLSDELFGSELKMNNCLLIDTE
ncbi:MAG: OB-fold putative lipoprotein [Bacteroidota bacterium]|nr:OB-fold putative lipoprotein [Bacteroidota bacterium]